MTAAQSHSSLHPRYAIASTCLTLMVRASAAAFIVLSRFVVLRVRCVLRALVCGVHVFRPVFALRLLLLFFFVFIDQAHHPQLQMRLPMSSPVHRQGDAAAASSSSSSSLGRFFSLGRRRRFAAFTRRSTFLTGSPEGPRGVPPTTTTTTPRTLRHTLSGLPGVHARAEGEAWGRRIHSAAYV